MSLGKKLFEARKRKKMSQEELADLVGTKGPAIGRYERDVSQPTIDTIVRLAKALDTSVDYLLGMTDKELEPQNANRLIEIQQLPEDVQDKIFYFLDMSIRDAKAKQAYAR